MITLLTGENSFEIGQVLDELKTDFSGQVETFDGAELAINRLPDLLMGVSLFSDRRLVVIKQLSDNSEIWSVLADWLPRLSDDVHLVLVEPKPDKRTKTWKSLQKISNVKNFPAWSDRDRNLAERWVEAETKRRQLKIDRKSISLLVSRVGIDQWGLWQALEKLSLVDEINQETIREVIDATPQENVFELFEKALNGDPVRVQEMVANLSLSEEPYRLFGLLSGQAFQLAALAAARSDSDVAGDFGVHPFVLSKLRPHANRLGIKGAARVVEQFDLADDQVKTTALDPWLAIEKTLLVIASRH